MRGKEQQAARLKAQTLTIKTKKEERMMTEVRQAVEESADIVRVFDYLREREEELSRYSDKLRKSVWRIANVFGDSDYCQICDYTQDKHDKEHKFLEKIEISVDIDGDEFLENEGEDEDEDRELCKLCLVDSRIKLKCYYEDNEDNEEHTTLYSLENVSRYLLKKIIKEKQIIKFIEKVKRGLDGVTDEYRRVSEIAEKLASALPC
jgi:hypothetical protein